jgi:hypothetical protein
VRRPVRPNLSPCSACAPQRGFVLIVGLIMLLLISLVAIAAIRSASSHLQVSGNEQSHAQTLTAANYALDLVINDATFSDRQLSTEPALTVAVDGAGGQVQLAAHYLDPFCSRYRFIKKQELVQKVLGGGGGFVYTVDPKNTSCISGQSSTGLTIVDTPTSTMNVVDNSLCATTLWEVQATAEDAQTGASTVVNQGIEMRMEIADAENKCKP